MSTNPGNEPPAHRDAAYYRVTRRRGWLRPTVGWVVWLVASVGAAVGFGAYAFVDEAISGANLSVNSSRELEKVVAPVDPGEPMNVLLLGSDSREKTGGDARSDSMILVRLDTRQGFISMMSFPRDSWVSIPGHGMGKLNWAYSFGEQDAKDGGPALVVKTITELTGQKINYFANIDFKGFVSVVNELGGVYIDVDRGYFHKNVPGGPQYSEISIAPGYQKLNGTDALAFVRYRHADSDFARIARQQMFLSELKRQLKSGIGNALKAPQIVRVMLDNAAISIPKDRRLDVIRFAIETPDSRVFRIMPESTTGMEGDQSVVYVSSASMAKAVQLWLQPPFTNVVQKKVDPKTVTVHVLNGSGRGMVADQVAAQLRAKGYRAETGGNAKDFSYASSVVLFNGATPRGSSLAMALQPQLGPSTGLSAVKPASLGGNDAVVVVGADYPGALVTPPKPVKEKEVADVVSTTALVEKFREIQRKTGMKLMVPTRLARNSAVRDVYVYRVGDKKRGPWAVKVVLELPSNGSFPRYWGIQATAMRNPPIMANPVGTWKKGDGLVAPQTYYNGKVLLRDAFTRNGVSYWVSNTLDTSAPLSSTTIHSIAQSFRPLKSAKLPKGTVDTRITISDDPETP